MAYQPVSKHETPPQYGTIGHIQPQIVAVQPTSVAVVSNYGTRRGVNTHGALIFSILVAVICGIAVPASLCCSIPAIVMAATAQNGQDEEESASNVRISYIFTTVALVFGLLSTVGGIIYLTYIPNQQGKTRLNT